MGVSTVHRCAPPDSTSPGSFIAVASAVGTDKVTTHDYHHLYSKYLDSIRNDQLRLLEIGLGCDMSYGPGQSAEIMRLYGFGVIECLHLRRVL